MEHDLYIELQEVKEEIRLLRTFLMQMMNIEAENELNDNEMNAVDTIKEKSEATKFEVGEIEKVDK